MSPTSVEDRSVVVLDKRGNFYVRGKPHSKARMMELAAAYESYITNNQNSNINQFKNAENITYHTAKKAAQFYETGELLHGKPGGTSGIGSRSKFKLRHHMYIYNLYLKQPDRPADSYIDKLIRRYNIRVSRSFISRWFRNIGPFKGTMRRTSKFPPRKFSKRNNKLLIEFFKIKKYTPNHRKFVFADEKPMKEIDVYGEVRRDPITGEVPVQECEANSKNRYNILSSVCLKKDAPHVDAVIIKGATTDASIFSCYVKQLVSLGMLQRGDIFVVDNCTVHFKGNNEFLADELFRQLGIMMIPLPPYHPELNPTENVFNTLLQRLRSKRIRGKLYANKNSPPAQKQKIFINAMLDIFADISYQDVKHFYRKCLYYNF